MLWGKVALLRRWDLKHAASLEGERPLAALDFPADGGNPPRGPLGPTRLTKPVIAAVEGPAVGRRHGAGVVVRSASWLRAPTRRLLPALGHPLIDGGTVRLPRLVGQGRALDIILTGRKVTAEKCSRAGDFASSTLASAAGPRQATAWSGWCRSDR